MSNCNQSSRIRFDIGTLVNVDSRTWPGINKPGGVGRVTAFCARYAKVDVNYSLGGREKDIDISFVQKHNFNGDDEGGTGRSRRRRQTNSDVAADEKISKKKAFKDASNKANKMTPKEQKSRGTVGVKRRAQESKVEKVRAKKKKKVVNTTSDQKLQKKNQPAKTKTAPILKTENSKQNKIINTKSETVTLPMSKSSKNSKTETTSKKKSSKKDETSSKIRVSPQEVQTTKKSLSTKSKHKGSKKDKAASKSKKYSVTKKLSKSKPSKKHSASINSATVSNNSPKASSTKKVWKIPSPTLVLQHVYKDMSSKASAFVQEVIGRKDSFVPSSPESASILEIQMETG